MFELRKTEKFAGWLDALWDLRARAEIQARIERLATGLIGDVKPLKAGVNELRIDYGPGYRVYFIKKGRTVIILLAGGDKKSQRTDIQAAVELAKQLEE